MKGHRSTQSPYHKYFYERRDIERRDAPGRISINLILFLLLMALSIARIDTSHISLDSSFGNRIHIVTYLL